MNKRLAKAIKKHLPEHEVSASIKPFTAAVSDLLEEHEQDRYIIERSMHCMSEELNNKNQQLSEELARHESMRLEAEANLVRLQALFDSVPEAMMSFYPGGALRSINQAGLTMIGLEEDEFLSMGAEENLAHWLSLLKYPAEFRAELGKTTEDKTLTISGRVDMKDGRNYQYYSVPEFLEGEYIGRSWCWQNITNIIEHQRLLEYQAYHDFLTRLPNRESLFSTLESELQEANENNGFVSVMFIDLDNFKNVNDIAGHTVGDQFIVEVANRLRASLSGDKTLGRLGGDEFLVISKGTLGNEIGEIQNIIKQAFKEPVEVGGHAFSVTCSVGVSVYPNDGTSSNELIRKADMSMYQAKEAGKNTFHYFDEKLEKEALERIAIENKLRQAIKDEEFNLVFQPKISLVDQSVLGVEALIRWTRPDGESISPALFIEIAENTGVVTKITRWVLQEAYKTLIQWKGTELDNIRMSVNISALDLKKPHFADTVLDLFDGEELDTSRLELELTESVLIGESKATRANLLLLRRAGIKLSIDDFGKGYSNFTYLQELNVDYLKIDRSIVNNIDGNAKGAAIARSIVDVAHNLGMKVIAEGAETLSENSYLKSIGCDYCQGYFYSKPLSQDDLAEYVKNSRGRLEVC